MLPKNLQAVIGVVFLLGALSTTAADTASQSSPKTTTSLLPLQPPVNVKSTTTTSVFGTLTDVGSVEKHLTVTSDSSDTAENEKKESRTNEIKDRSIAASSLKLQRTTSDTLGEVISNGEKGVFPLLLNSRSKNNYSFIQSLPQPKPINASTFNSEGYLHFEVEEEKVRAQNEPSKAETVKEVLSNLFPKGFSDIFRFSYAAEPSTTTETQSKGPKSPARSSARTQPKQKSALKHELGSPSTPRGFQAKKEVQTSLLLQSKDSQSQHPPTHQPTVHQEIKLQNSKPEERQKYPNRTFEILKSHVHRTLSSQIPSSGENETHKISEYNNPNPANSKPLLSARTQFEVHQSSKPQNLRIQESFKLQNSYQLQTSSPQPFKSPENNEIELQNPTNKSFNHRTILPLNFTPQHSIDKPQNSRPLNLATQILHTEIIPTRHRDNKTLYSFETSISKEYRRELSPGHTQIVIEKVHYPKERSGLEFQDGLNTISKDILLRINRAAEHASVLPSLLLEPTKQNATSEETLLSINGPIVILKDNSAEAEDSVDRATDEDNLLAESQYVSQNVYQQLPEDFKEYPPYKAKSPEINVQFIPSGTLPQSPTLPTTKPLFTPASELPQEEVEKVYARPRQTRISHELDNFQEHAERNFHSGNSLQEAPSRKFLKNFNPLLSSSTNIPISKGGFHYEVNGAPSGQQNGYQSSAQQNGYPASEEPQRFQSGHSSKFEQPAAKMLYQDERENSLPNAALHTKIQHSKAQAMLPDYQADFQATPAPSGIYQYRATTQSPNKVLFVTITPPKGQANIKPFQTPHEYVSEAAASLRREKIANRPSTADSYTFVEVQKAFNIHNKLIKERDGKLLEQQETTYYQPQYAQEVSVAPAPASAAARSQDFSTFENPTEYVSLATHPINVDDPYEQQGGEEAASASHDAAQHLAPPQEFLPGPSNYYIQQIEEHPVPYALPLQHQQAEPQAPHQTGPEAVVIEKQVETVPQTQIIEHHGPEIYPVQEVVEKIIERPVPVEKIIDRPVQVPYPVPVDRYIDRPYPVPEIVEKHIPMPYPVIEQVGVPVHIDRYIDRPYPVETIVEKPVPYPVEKVVEKIVTKHVPVEVQKLVEKPVEKIVEKIVDRPIAVPIRVPIGIPVTMYGHYALAQAHPHPQAHHSHFPLQSPPPQHPNALGWSGGPPYAPAAVLKLPEKVLQNYYARMLKKLHPKLSNIHKSAYTAASNLVASKPTVRPTVALVKAVKPPFKILDIRFDLKPPPPSTASWNQGARYVYNTLPLDLTSASAFSGPGPGQQADSEYFGRMPHDGAHEEYQQWRNGHSLKRSPDFGRNLHMEYGFKPPLVPSVEINDQGVPLNAGVVKVDD